MARLTLSVTHPAWRKQATALRKITRTACKAALSHEGIKSAEISIVLSDDDAIRALNRDFRGKDKATNVLAFPSEEHPLPRLRGRVRVGETDAQYMTRRPSPPPNLPPQAGGGIEKIYLGDIMISLDTVAREAKAQGKTFEDHLSHLVVHACLHLLGHDHEKKTEAALMEQKEVEILQRLGIIDPYR